MHILPNEQLVLKKKKPLGREKAKTQTVHYFLLFQIRLLTARPHNTLAHEHRLDLCITNKRSTSYERNIVNQWNITSDGLSVYWLIVEIND